LKNLCGFDDFESFQAAHRRWVETAVSEVTSQRESTWTQAVAVGTETFVEKIKKQLKWRLNGESRQLIMAGS